MAQRCLEEHESNPLQYYVEFLCINILFYVFLLVTIYYYLFLCIINYLCLKCTFPV